MLWVFLYKLLSKLAIISFLANILIGKMPLWKAGCLWLLSCSAGTVWEVAIWPYIQPVSIWLLKKS